MNIKKYRKIGEIMGVHLDSTSNIRLLRYARGKLANFGKTRHKQKPFLMVTPNPEIIICAQKDKELLKILNFADISLPDGIGLAQAKKFYGLPNPKNIFRPIVLLLQGILVGLATFINREYLLRSFNLIKGREMFLELCKLANKKGWRVFLLGGEGGVSKEVAEKLRLSLKKIKIESAEGPFLDKKAKPVSKDDALIEREVVRAINKFKPHLLFVAFGPPKQEKWAYRWLSKLDVGGAMVVGGTFDFIAGKAKLPPEWMEKAGLEWLWRLLHQPWRLGRILVATIVFPVKVFWTKLIS